MDATVLGECFKAGKSAASMGDFLLKNMSSLFFTRSLWVYLLPSELKLRSSWKLDKTKGTNVAHAVSQKGSDQLQNLQGAEKSVAFLTLSFLIIRDFNSKWSAD